MDDQTPTTVDTPPRKKRGALLVHEFLRDDIMWMRIDPGSALDEVALARRFEVSRTPIREALLLLENEGFVQFLPNRSTIVAPLSMHNHAAFLDTVLLLSRGLVRSAAMNKGADREQLSGLVADYDNALAGADIELGFRAQLELYRQIAGLARNRFLSKYFLEAHDAWVRTKLLYYFPYLGVKDRAASVGQLNSIVKAIARGDAEAGDGAIAGVIMFETAVIQKALGPRFADTMDVGARFRAAAE